MDAISHQNICLSWYTFSVSENNIFTARRLNITFNKMVDKCKLCGHSQCNFLQYWSRMFCWSRKGFVSDNSHELAKANIMDLCSAVYVEGIISENRTSQDCLFLAP
jgi:hypothetical protein